MDLILTDSLSTTMTECLSVPCPVVAYSNPKFILPKEKYIDLYENLIKSNIIFEKKESIDQFLFKYFDSNSVWLDPERKNSIDKFFEYFGKDNEYMDINTFNNKLVDLIRFN